jgi:hypothetical protein
VSVSFWEGLGHAGSLRAMLWHYHLISMERCALRPAPLDIAEVLNLDIAMAAH